MPASGAAAPTSRHAAWLVLKYWPFINLVVVCLLLSSRLRLDAEMEEPKCASPPQQQEPGDDGDGEGCPNDCSGRGVCVQGECACELGWDGDDCGDAVCPNGCSGRGKCLESGRCVCSRLFTGPDCATEVFQRRIDKVLSTVGRPFSAEGNFDEDVELVVSAKSTKKYPRVLCRTKACALTWAVSLSGVTPFLPRESWRPSYKTCAIVSSSKHVLKGYNITAEKGRIVNKGWGDEIDAHAMVLRFDNAPTAGYQRMVGTKTTHRLVAGDYARLVHSLLGTEVVTNQTKSVVTASTWWASGVPSPEKVVYLMSVPGIASKPGETGGQIRAPDHNAYAPFTEAFPGNRRYLLSPILLKRVYDAHEHVREAVRLLELGCYKDSAPTLSQMFLAVLLSLQICTEVDVYGVELAVPGTEANTLLRRDKRFRARYRSKAPNGDCCYYPNKDDFKAEVPLMDELTRSHAFRLLQKTGRLRVHG